MVVKVRPRSNKRKHFLFATSKAELPCGLCTHSACHYTVFCLCVIRIVGGVGGGGAAAADAGHLENFPFAPQMSVELLRYAAARL